MPFHKVVRAISRQCEIVYEDKEGRVKMDDIVDPLPFDVNAPIVEISDRDFAIWYADLSDDVKNTSAKRLNSKVWWRTTGSFRKRKWQSADI